MDFKALAEQYRNELLDNVMPFWLEHSRDEEAGGYFTCLDKEGAVFDSDKFVWLQAREVWTFAMMYNKLQHKQQWLDFSLHGAKFLQSHGHDQEGNWYFSLTREGKPLVQPYNIFSDCFACMAFGQVYKATKQERYGAIAKRTFQRILARKQKTKGSYDKVYPGTRPLKNFALPMILCNLSLQIESLLDQEVVNQTIKTCVHQVMNVFLQKDGLILENVTPDGSFSDCFQGRLLNPGHAIQAMWFIMDLSTRLKDKSLAQKAVDVTLRTLQHGWDQKHGGIFYFLDVKGFPPQQLEWDQKLWWVHLETLVALLKGYEHTKRKECLEWFQKVHDYTWSHFADKKEWFGYLNRQGEVLLPLKGGKWKGCFHVPRGLFQCYKSLQKI